MKKQDIDICILSVRTFPLLRQRHVNGNPAKQITLPIAVRILRRIGFQKVKFALRYSSPQLYPGWPVSHADCTQFQHTAALGSI